MLKAAIKKAKTHNPIKSRQELENCSAYARIQWARKTYDEGLVMSTSFGIQSAVLLHLVTQQIPNIPVIFIDTGYLFPETYDFAKKLTNLLNLNLKTYKSEYSPEEQESYYGKLWEQGVEGLDRYNVMNKVEPMNRAISELNAKAWLSGVRRTQSKSRRNLSVSEQQHKTIKLYPIIDWDDETIDKYLIGNNLPYHPLKAKNYVSVGDWHSSSPLKPNMADEDTRFNGLKRECGLHLPSGISDYQI
tara:strand:- start:1783 stop:2520 length:738 start_codon:yes stop_codon:yes gene_type:complete